MKKHFSLIILISLTFIGCNHKSQKLPFDNSIQKEHTLIKGKVNDWPTDTIYMATLPFQSPFSTIDRYMILDSDKRFEFVFNGIEKPFILCLTPEKIFLDHRSFLLFECFTEEYYKGYCKNFFTMPMSTYIIEPNTETIVELNKDGRYGETEIYFLNDNSYSSKYYQTTFSIDQNFDEILTHSTLLNSKIITETINKFENMIAEQLEKLDQNELFISPFVFKYVRAEIIFGAKKELLRDLMLDNAEYASNLLKFDIPDNLIKMIEFDRNEFDYATLISQEYNEFIELYLNFKNSVNNKKLIVYMSFNTEKYDLAEKELPNLAKYYYLANNLLFANCNEESFKLFERLLEKYPAGELNDKLLEKYKITVGNKL